MPACATRSTRALRVASLEARRSSSRPNLETFQQALAPHRTEIAADVANYTDIAPIVQISEIVEA